MKPQEGPVETSEEFAARALVMSRLLFALDPLLWLNMGMLFVAFFYAGGGGLFLGINVLSGMAALFLKVRLAVDARLFADLAENKLNLERLDRALSILGRKALPYTRDLHERSMSTLRLIKMWAAATTFQIVFLVCTGLSAV